MGPVEHACGWGGGKFTSQIPCSATKWVQDIVFIYHFWWNDCEFEIFIIPRYCSRFLNVLYLNIYFVKLWFAHQHCNWADSAGCLFYTLGLYFSLVLYYLIMPSFLLHRWKFCRCRVQIQCQHILQRCASCSDTRCEWVWVLCDFLPICLPHTWPSILLFFFFRVFSLRTKRSSSTMPFWHFYPRRLNYLHLTLSWRVISRLFDGWWPQRPASRRLPSYPSKNAVVICVHLALIFSRVSCLLTGMLCHSKVWSRVWRHRCNVNMNPYISVPPFACFHPSTASFFLDLYLAVCRSSGSFLFSSQAFQNAFQIVELSA